MSRKNLPKLTDDKNLTRGEFDWAVSDENVTCVSVLSCLPDCTDTVIIKRKERNRDIDVRCPKAVSDYNKNMGFVDHFDHLKSLYEIDRKSRKWWCRLFFHFLDMTVINAYILYNMLPNINADIKNVKTFRMEVIRSLVVMGKEGTSKKRKLSSPVQMKAHKFNVLGDVRLANAQHLPVRSTSKGCTVCSTRQKPKRTRWMCQTCKVGLCMYGKDASCFENFHK
ncbi:piggyBac transposable element-derived protein 3 [Trichonephila clavata]|uniref:PiggyBac transposable element-derived protein 3 n=1 Tax=Trichonephila clavata TaxID=2740835 RepID=A0A8X6F854_TRICU|nr:piggyBac transposable element-derived protein 3 [Trichonephila clavata]